MSSCLWMPGAVSLFVLLSAIARESEGSSPPPGGRAALVSPDGAWVVRARARAEDGAVELFSARLHGGGDPVRIAGPLSPSVSWTIAPGGRRVVYLDDQLFSTPIDGSSCPARIGDPLAGEPLDFALAPDGSSVVYRAGPAGRYPGLYRVPVDGRGRSIELLAPNDQGEVNRGYAVDPDGTAVVFTSFHEDGEISRLYRVPIDGGQAVRLSPPRFPVHGFRIAPEGARVVYRGAERENAFELHAVPIDGSLPPASLTGVPAVGKVVEDFQFSRDGAWVVYHEDQGDGNRALFGVPADGSALPVELDGETASMLLEGSGPGAAPFRPQLPIRCTCGFSGYRDFSFGLSGSSAPTGEKPESKLWWTDGSWWGSLYHDAAQEYRIHRLDWASQDWVDTGTALDTRNSTKADVLWDEASRKLYVASHVFSTNPQPTPTDWGQLFRYSYHASGTYGLDPGFPVDITRGNARALTIAKEPGGRLWASWVEASRVMVNHSTGGPLEWEEPFVLPTDTTSTSVSTDDISAIVAFGDSIGVMWSNQLTATTYFAVHRDGDPPDVWQPEEECTGACSGDLLNLKSTADGRVWAVLKTSLESSFDPLNLVTVRSQEGAWQSSVFGLVRDHHTRPILLLDEENARAYVFATSPENGGAIYYKSAPMDDLTFEPGLGAEFIRTPVDLVVSNATSTKQSLSSQTDLVVLASDRDTRMYLHGYLDLAPAGAPVIDRFAPASGPVGATVTVLGRDLARAEHVEFGGSPAVFTVVTSTRIDATVPGDAVSGRIRVTTPGGTATSSLDFTVERAPAVTAFSPLAGPVGTAVTVFGTELAGATRVAFNGTPALFTVASAERIDTIVPVGAATGRITVTAPYGTGTSARDFVVNQPPVIASFTPASGPEGTTVEILGARLDMTMTVEFNGLPASFTFVNNGRLDAVVPDGATTGPITVVTMSGSDTSDIDFVVVGPPGIDSFAPTSGSAGTRVTIRGSGLTDAAVEIGGLPALDPLVVDDGCVLATVPPGAGSGTIAVTTPLGRAESAMGFALADVRLWPPNHELRLVEVVACAGLGSLATATIEGVWQDEPVLGIGDGDTGPDAWVQDGGRVWIRAERDGGGDGRVVHVHFTATDALGHSCPFVLLVTVPPAAGGVAFDDGELYDATR